MVGNIYVHHGVGVVLVQQNHQTVGQAILFVRNNQAIRLGIFHFLNQCGLGKRYSGRGPKAKKQGFHGMKIQKSGERKRQTKLPDPSKKN